jgi:hypothetical protein
VSKVETTKKGILEQWNIGIMKKPPKTTTNHESTNFGKHEKGHIRQDLQDRHDV